MPEIPKDRSRGLAWVRRLRSSLPSASGFESTHYLSKWALLSTAVGIVAGVGAMAFYFAIELVTSTALGKIVGYLPPAPVGEGNRPIGAMLRPWLLPLVTTLGGLASGLIVFRFAPEAEGHGTDAAIAAIHHQGGRIRARIPIVKLVASAITIGTGGSAGREGPAAQISAGFGSLLGGWLKCSPRDRRILVAAGMGAGIGAIFRAPLGGALLAAEILYVHDLEVEVVIPALIASIVGYSIFGAYFGFTPIFGIHPELALDSPVQLLFYAMLGALSGLVGILYARTFYGLTHLFHEMSLPKWLKPAIGGLAIGLFGLAMPQVLHTGYGWVQLSMAKETLFALPLWVVILLPFAKILATSLSIGSGGSGGIFGPGMVIGGSLGALFWRVTYGWLPNIPAQPAPFVIIGMIAFFGGIAHAPLAVMLMVAEMTGNLSLLAPAMIAVAVSTALVGDETIYRAQLRDRASSPFHRIEFSYPLLSTLTVSEAMTSIAPEARPETDKAIAEAKLVLQVDQTLDVALERLVEGEASWAPVARGSEPVGRVTVRDILRSYRSRLQRGARRASVVPGDTVLLEFKLGPSSPLIGQTLSEANLPKTTTVVFISRAGETLFPRASTTPAEGDLVGILVSRAAEDELRTFLGR